MRVGTKLVLQGLFILRKTRRARKFAKKAESNQERYNSTVKSNYNYKKAKSFLKLLKIDLEVKGRENLPRKSEALLAPNHASLIDPLVLLCAMHDPKTAHNTQRRELTFIAKDDLLKKKKILGFAKVQDTFFIDRNNARNALKTLTEFRQFIKENKKFGVIFPEGTRSKDGEIKDFQAGSFKIAKEGYIPIVPVTINNTLSATNKSRSKRLKVQVIFGKQIKANLNISRTTKSIAEIVKKEVKKSWKKPEGKPGKKEKAA